MMDPIRINEDAGALSFETAVALFHRTLPGYGFKLLVPPHHEKEAVASVWQHGEIYSATCRRSTPAEALLACVEIERERRRLRERLLDCGRCRGIGWHIGQNGVRRVCDHRRPAADK